MLKIVIDKQADKFASRLPQKQQEKISKTIAILEANPYQNSLNITKLTGMKGKFYRVRIGDLRIIYEIDDEANCLFISEIGFRGNVY